KQFFGLFQERRFPIVERERWCSLKIEPVVIPRQRSEIEDNEKENHRRCDVRRFGYPPRIENIKPQALNIASSTANVCIHPIRLPGIVDEPEGGFQSIVKAGFLVRGSRRLLQCAFLGQSPCNEPDEK